MTDDHNITAAWAVDREFVQGCTYSYKYVGTYIVGVTDVNVASFGNFKCWSVYFWKVVVVVASGIALRVLRFACNTSM